MPVANHTLLVETCQSVDSHYQNVEQLHNHQSAVDEKSTIRFRKARQFEWCPPHIPTMPVANRNLLDGICQPVDSYHRKVQQLYNYRSAADKKGTVRIR